MIALVTGAASGLGRALADELEGGGWEVVRADRQPGEVELDVCDAQGFQSAVDEVYRLHGRLDLLVNNAGIASAGEAHRLEPEDWSRVLDVNLQGTINGIRATYPSMVAQRSGSILNVASLAGLLGSPGLLPYATSKWAVVGLSLSLRAEARRHGIKVCTFCPGFLKTNIFESTRYRGIDPVRMEQKLPFPVMAVEGGARAALQGLKKNRAIITYPFYASLITWPMRLNLALAELLVHRQGVSNLLACRTDPESP